jgi:hypothetical protein
VGEYSAAGAVACDVCAAAGLEDHDSDPTTPCQAPAAAGTCSQDCDPNTEDADCDQSSECTECAPGSVAPGGTYSFATRCVECPGGSYSDGSTCVDCGVGTYGTTIGAADASVCLPCEVGTWAPLNGSVVCTECGKGTYRSSNDAFGCVACTDEAYRCDAEGLTQPRAAPGWFLEHSTPDNPAAEFLFYECFPFQACSKFNPTPSLAGTSLTRARTPLNCLAGGRNAAGTCPWMPCTGDGFNSLEACPLDPDYGSCPGAESGQICALGYTGSRCSACVEYDETVGECDGLETPNGYYRLNEFCEPCPCTWLTFSRIMMIGCLFAIASIFVLDYVMKEVEHLSTVFAPVRALVKACQHWRTDGFCATRAADDHGFVCPNSGSVS